MKQLVVDSSSLISLSTNCLTWIIKKFHQQGYQFVITPTVKNEVITKALRINRFRLGAIRILKLIGDGSIIVKETDNLLSKKIMQLGNNIYKVKGRSYKIIHQAEMDLVPIALKTEGSLMLIDERITNKLFYDPEGLRQLFERRLHTQVIINQEKLREFKKITSKVALFKSSDLIIIANEKGLLRDYIKECDSNKTMKDFINGVLWGLKYSGCSISTNDINEYMKLIKY